MLLMLTKRQCFFLCLSKFQKLKDLESTNHCKRMHFQESERVFRVTLKGKSGINQI